jgi:LPS sulfotransferase NodH
MARNFDQFIIIAGMRTGSNFLEEELSQHDGIKMFGEAFNPNFFGNANKQEMLGITLKERELDPISVLRKMKSETPVIGGFRFFHDHDPRVLKHCISDTRCAKIILRRNQLDSYISLKIARATNQWRLSDVRKAKSAKAVFNIDEFEKYMNDQQDFFTFVTTALKKSGQVPFSISYNDVSDPEIVSGLAAYLGAGNRAEDTKKTIIRQNAKSTAEKVENFAQMTSDLAKFDYFQMDEEPKFEPPRGPIVPAYLAAENPPILFMPIRSGPGQLVAEWLAQTNGTGTDELVTGFTQKSLRQWKRRHKGHHSFTVVRHPVARLFDAYFRYLALPGPDQYDEIYQTLKGGYGVAFPKPENPAFQDAEQHKAALKQFAEFVKHNLAGQTSVRVDGAWASQSEVVRGMGGFANPDHIFREHSLQEALNFLSTQMGSEPHELGPNAAEFPISLEDVYDEELETLVRSAYQRDYMIFGFGGWRD